MVRMRVSVMRIRFNPRQYVGCDFCSMVIFVALLLFQSSHPRRVRPASPPYLYLSSSFNPRTHVGCDLFNDMVGRKTQLFQSTHPRRVRLQDVLAIVAFNKFQSTHPRRVRHWKHLPMAPAIEFQSTHPRRVRRMCSRFRVC